MANILYEVQNFLVEKLSSDSELSGNCTFIAENKKDIEYEIKNALGRQGVCGIVMTPKALYAGKFEDQSLVWQLDELEIDIIENVTVNRGKKNGNYMTGQDIAMQMFNVLCPLSGENEGQFSPVSLEEGEDNGLLVNKCVFKCLVHGGAEEPEPSPEPLQFSVVKLFAEEPPLSVTRKDGWLWPSGDQFILWSHNSPNALGDVTAQQMSAFVTQKLGNYYTKSETSSAVQISTALANYYTKTETSSAAEISSALDSKADKTQLDNYYTKNETSSAVEISAALDSKADNTQLDNYYTKSETSSAAEISAAAAQLCSYTDSQVSSKAAKSELSSFLPLSGGTVSGTTEFNDIVKFNSYIEVFGVTESPQFNLVDQDEDQAVIARLLSSGTVQLEDSAGHRAVLSVRDGGTVAYVQDILEQVSSFYTKSETSSAAQLSALEQELSTYTDIQVSSKADKSQLSDFWSKDDTLISSETGFEVGNFNSLSDDYNDGILLGEGAGVVGYESGGAVVLEQKYVTSQAHYKTAIITPSEIQLVSKDGDEEPVVHGHLKLPRNDGQNTTLATLDDISSAMSSITSASCLSTEGFSKAGFDTDYQKFYGRGAGLVNLSSSGVLVAQTSSFTPLFGSRWQTAIYTADRIIHELSAQDEHGDLNKQEFRFPVYTDGAPYHNLAIDSDIDRAVSSKADRDELSSYYTKTETSSAAELSAAVGLKQDKLTEQQLKRIDTPCIPLMISSNVEVSGSNYLDFNCTTRFHNYAVFNGAVDTVQLNLRDDNLDTQVMLSVASEKKLLAVGGFNNELTSTLNIKNGDIAYTSDIEEAVSSLAAKSELSSGLALKADISSVQSQLSGKLDKSGGTVTWLGVGRPEQRIAADQQKLGYVFSIDDYGSASLLPQMNTDVNLLMPSADGTLATLGDLSAAVSSAVSTDVDYMYEDLPDISAAADHSFLATLSILMITMLRWQQRHPDKVAPFVPPEPEPDEEEP